MSDDIPFNKDFDLAAGIADAVTPLVRRIVCPNPGPFTFTGTVSFVVGRGKVAIIDPGPDDPAHIAALLDAVRGETVTDIVVTHTHRDHSPAAKAVQEATGARIVGCGVHVPARPLHIGEVNKLDYAADTDYAPDLQMRDGDVITGPGWTLEAVETPGHTANHVSFALREELALFSGDHVMGWATSIVAPPDGAMSDYMASLEKLGGRQEQVFHPAHGTFITDAPRFVAAYIRHRQGREASILHRLNKGAADIPTIVRAVYIGLDPRLSGAAALSVLAHMEDLTARGIISTDGPPAIDSTYRLA